ncbi:polysaccharide biosynthesis C-terminal domain-containing protein [Bacillus sp. SORGH_AS_0510]|uniref:oligosaccharide flippase family protein n=1 Tax=Bacillus sp. SORGH_AS_0510 TaxID=3041771 RepID=UPI0027D7E4B2|nr:polysaccharide biosynthesis C-terminal domain-containing protein [Bacillus sp. SORGH_AS_0510]
MNTFINKSRIGRDTIIYIPVFLTPALVNIILLMVFTRYFSPKEYGTYTIVVNTTIILSSLLTQWIILSIQRFRPEYSHKGTINEFNRHLNHLLLYLSLGFVLLSIPMYLFLPFSLQPYQEYYWPSVLLITSSIYFMVLSGIYQVDLQSKKYRNLNVIQSLLKLLIIIGMVNYLHLAPVAFVWGSLLAQLLVTTPMLRYVHTNRMFKPKKTSKDSFRKFVKKLWTYGFPLIGWYIGTTVMNLTDRFMIEYFRSSHEVGIYSANFTIAVQAIALICNPLFFAVQPRMMNEIQQNKDKEYIEQKISHYTQLFIMISLPFGVYFSIYRKEVSSLLLGEQFTSGAIIIPILIFGFFAWNIGLYGQLVYQITKKTKEMFYFVTVAAIVNFALNLYFIPQWGYVGAAISTTIGFFLYSSLLYFFSFRLIQWKFPWMVLGKNSILVLTLSLPVIFVKNIYLQGVSPLVSMLVGIPYFLIYIGAVFFLWKNTLKNILA